MQPTYQRYTTLFGHITFGVLAILAIVGGLVGIPEFMLHSSHRLTEFLNPIFIKSNAILAHHEIPHQTEWILTGVSTILIIMVSVWAWNKYKNYQLDNSEETGLAKVLKDKYYVDEFYDAIIVRPLKYLSLLFNNVIEKSGIDGLVNGVGKSVQWGSRQLRLLQSGLVGTYILWMVLGILIFFVITITILN